MDVQMPEMDGLEATRARSSSASAPETRPRIVAMTANAMRRRPRDVPRGRHGRLHLEADPRRRARRGAARHALRVLTGCPRRRSTLGGDEHRYGLVAARVGERRGVRRPSGRGAPSIGVVPARPRRHRCGRHRDGAVADRARPRRRPVRPGGGSAGSAAPLRRAARERPGAALAGGIDDRQRRRPRRPSAHEGPCRRSRAPRRCSRSRTPVGARSTGRSC